METCAGCRQNIDPAFDSVARDNLGHPWHTACMTRARGATGREDQVQGVGALWAWALVTLLLPIVGLIVGLVYLFRNRVGPGLALVIEAAVLFAVYAVLLSSSASAATVRGGCMGSVVLGCGRRLDHAVLERKSLTHPSTPPRCRVKEEVFYWTDGNITYSAWKRCDPAREKRRSLVS